MLLLPRATHVNRTCANDETQQPITLRTVRPTRPCSASPPGRRPSDCSSRSRRRGRGCPGWRRWSPSCGVGPRQSVSLSVSQASGRSALTGGSHLPSCTGMRGPPTHSIATAPAKATMSAKVICCFFEGGMGWWMEADSMQPDNALFLPSPFPLTTTPHPLTPTHLHIVTPLNTHSETPHMFINTYTYKNVWLNTYLVRRLHLLLNLHQSVQRRLEPLVLGPVHLVRNGAVRPPVLRLFWWLVWGVCEDAFQSMCMCMHARMRM